VCHVAEITSLRVLDIGGNPIGEQVKHLTALQNLRELNVSNCEIDDTSMQHIAKLNLLEKLDLSMNEDIKKDGLFHLEKLDYLREVDVKHCWGLKGMACFTFRNLKPSIQLLHPVLPPLR